VLRCPSRLCCVIVSPRCALIGVLLVLVRFGEIVDGWMDVLRARKRSSERTAIAFIRRTETGGEG
jgi:hypothetical protein